MKKITGGSTGKKFGKDFLTGCGSLILLGIILFVVIPILLFILKISVFLTLIIGIFAIAIVLIASWGRLVNFLRKQW